MFIFMHNLHNYKYIFFSIFFVRAMASASGKEEFLKQFEAIVAGVKRNKTKVKKKYLLNINTSY